MKAHSYVHLVALAVLGNIAAAPTGFAHEAALNARFDHNFILRRFT